MGGGPPRFPQGFPCPVVLGWADQEDRCVFAYRTITFFGGPFQVLRLTPGFVTSRPPRTLVSRPPTTPPTQRVRPYT